MSSSEKTCILDEMLDQLSLGRQSMTKQISTISDIVDKSNNVLLQIERTRTMKPPANEPHATPYSYNKETVQTLAKIVEQFQHLLNSQQRTGPGPTDNGSEGGRNLEDYIQHNRQRTEYLGSSVRKLLAVADTVAQMRANLMHMDDIDENADDALSSE